MPASKKPVGTKVGTKGGVVAHTQGPTVTEQKPPEMLRTTHLNLLAKVSEDFGASRAINIYVEVTDQDGAPVNELRKEDFGVWLDGGAENILSHVLQMSPATNVYLLSLHGRRPADKGQFVYIIRVERGLRFRGTTLAELLNL